LAMFRLGRVIFLRPSNLLRTMSTSSRLGPLVFGQGTQRTCKHHVKPSPMTISGSPARCWWTFKYFGHDQVHVLNGGLTQWKKEGRAVDQGPPEAPTPSASYVAVPRPALVLNAQQVLSLLDTKDQIIDARGPSRFYAKEPEPRPGMRGGHMPGALNVPFGKVLAADDFSVAVACIDGGFSLMIGVARRVRLAGTTLVATTCGSGVTASVLTLGLHLLDVPLER
ncbi:hypothetical protein DYB26_013320, partial [Aphanomyces astaci]